MRRAVRRFEVLDQIAQVSDRGGSLRETLDAICEIVVPEIADFCMIDLVKDETVDRIAVRVGPGAGQKVVERLAGRHPSLPPEMSAGFSEQPIEARFFQRISDADLAGLSHDAEDLEFLRGLGVNSAITVALRARGKLTGALTLAVAWSGRHYSQGDARFAGVLSGRVALTLENAGLFSDLERSEEARAEIA